MADALPYLRFVHLVAAAVWTGGLIVLAALVVTLRKGGASVEMLRAAARQFARVSWTAMAIAVATGIAQVLAMHLPWTYGRLHVKMGLVALAILIAGFHQVTARKTSPAMRGMIQVVVMALGLAIYGAAVAL